MIALLHGKLAAANLNRIIIDVNGVGYEVTVSLNTLAHLKADENVRLLVYTAVRENAIELYGFSSNEEKSLFEMLIGVGGIGPKLSITILSATTPDEFIDAVTTNNVARLTAIPGIGKKSSERIILELKEKIAKLKRIAGTSGLPVAGDIASDLTAALISLGFKEKHAESTARKVIKHNDQQKDLPGLIKAALRELTATD